MPYSETVERILDTAEQLFSEQGFSNTSVRQITGQAEVNLAAVNYHFGSKGALVQAVFARFLGPFCVALDESMGRYEVRVPAQDRRLEEVLDILARQVLSMELLHQGKLPMYMRLLGLAFTECQPDLINYLESLYGRVFRRYTKLLHGLLPDLSSSELLWYLRCMLGTAVFTFSGKADCAKSTQAQMFPASAAETLERLVFFWAAGLRSRSLSEALA